MRESIKKRIGIVEAQSGPTKPMIICYSSDEDLEEKIAEWEASECVASKDVPLIIIRDASQRSETV